MSSRRDFMVDAALGVGAWLSLRDVVPLAAQSATTQVFYDPATLKHEPSADHPERPQRMQAVLESVRSLEKAGRLSVASPRPASEDHILLVHTPDYLNTVR